MTGPTVPADLLAATREAAGLGRAAREARAEGPVALQPGDVLVLAQCEEPHLVWVVLRREDEETGRSLLVAADANPLVGSGDVSLPGPGGGSLTLRCRFSLWSSERSLATHQLLGCLADENLSIAERRWQAIAAGQHSGTFTEQETEEDPEYLDWIDEVVRPSLGRLESSHGSSSAATVLSLPARASEESALWSTRPLALRWAAGFALAVLGLGGGLLVWHQARQIAQLQTAAATRDEENRRTIADLEAQRANLEAEHRSQLAAAGTERERLEAEYRAKLADLEAELAKLHRATEVRNPLLAALDSTSALRGQPLRLEVGREASHVVLLLPVDDPAGSEFQIEVLDRISGETVFRQKGLRVDVLGEVRLGLPVSLVPPGVYRLLLKRKVDGAWVLAREHVIQFVAEPERRRPRW